MNTSTDRAIVIDRRRGLPALRTGYWQCLVAWIIIAALIVVLVAGVFVPVYGDEVAAIFMRGMFIANGWKLNTLLPQCGPEFLSGVPALLVPGAVTYDLVYSLATGPLFIRLAGILTALLWFGAAGALIIAQVRSQRLGCAMLASLASIVGLGVLPLTMVMMRSEQILLLLLTLFLAFPVVLRRDIGRENSWRLLILAAAFCLVVSIFCYTHPKALFFAPLILISAWSLLGSRSKLVCAIVSAFAIGCLWQTLQFAALLTKCGDAPALAKLLASNVMPLGGLVSSPRAFVVELFNNIDAAPLAMLRHMVFADQYQSAWLAPSAGLGNWDVAVRINQGIQYVTLLVFRVAFFLPPAVFLLKALLRKLDGATWCLSALWIGLLGHLALYKAWNFYGAALMVPIAALLVMLCVAALSTLGGDRLPRLVKSSMALLPLPFYMLFLCSSALLLGNVLPQTIRSVNAADIGLPDQGLSIPSFGYARQRDRIRDFAEQCHIRGDGARHLVVDNLTFFAFDGLREPLQSDYLYEHGFGVDLQGDALPRLLKRLGSQAVIAQCTIFPGAFAGKVHREGNLCCVDLSSSP
ncbi:hypothetical protein SAMN05216345_101973 [Cupriavidus sp. YR651]|uniref:hypothetical protein n=1 Tax=Cupriavidus sp. YR651 TaxID=1855315 RepID=UPI0008842FCE|nr:hypothetical protein [Cupriavidus sp. YR651]SDC22147.1 hypothetical protein SAMN05216345_101973 [Cupriavidus sp. YR651]